MPIVVPGLSASSSSSLSISTPMTLLRQEIDHSYHPPAIVSSESVDRQERGDPYGTDHHPATVSSESVEGKNGEPVVF